MCLSRKEDAMRAGDVSLANRAAIQSCSARDARGDVRAWVEHHQVGILGKADGTRKVAATRVDARATGPAWWRPLVGDLGLRLREAFDLL